MRDLCGAGFVSSGFLERSMSFFCLRSFVTPPYPPPPPSRPRRGGKGEPDLASGFWISFYGSNDATMVGTPSLHACGRSKHYDIGMPPAGRCAPAIEPFTTTAAEKSRHACADRGASVVGAWPARRNQIGRPFPPRRGCQATALPLRTHGGQYASHARSACSGAGGIGGGRATLAGTQKQ